MRAVMRGGQCSANPGGGDSDIGCVCSGFENGPILNDTFWCKTYP